MPSGTFKKYPHVERMGHPQIAGIDVGLCHIFPKLDGTNASVWCPKDGGLCAGSRTRELSDGADNAGFLKYVLGNERILKFADVHGDRYRLYGEWLVPHTIRTYRDDAWRKFYIFDVFDHELGTMLPYDDYQSILESYGLDHIPPMAIIENPAEADLQRLLEANDYLTKDGSPPGEGIVIKNYGWLGQNPEQPWGKLVRNEFKEENKKVFGAPEPGATFQVECAIAEEFCTSALVAKERSKIVFELAEKDVDSGLEPRPAVEDVDACYVRVTERHRGKVIPRLLGVCYYCVVTEELWAALKKHKDPEIDFKRLRQFVIAQVKRHAPDLF